MIKEKLSQMIMAAIKSAVSSGMLKIEHIPPLTVEVPRNRKYGDLSSSISFLLSKEAGKPALDISKILLEVLKQDIQGKSGKSCPVKKIEVAGGGFLNFFLNEEYLRQNLCNIITLGTKYGSLNIGKGKKIQVEFASVGPTGPIHIGHARGAVIGDVLSGILKKAGFKVEKEYYINDVGTQIEILGRSLRAKYSELCGHTPEVVENGYEGEYLLDIARILKEKSGSKCLDKDIEFFSSFAVKEILKDIKKDLKDFGVDFDSWVAESSLHRSGEVKKVIELLKKRGWTTLRDGALWFGAPSEEGSETAYEKDNVLIRSNGAPTYFASDIAYHCNKYQRKFDIMIDIWGQDHHGHVQRVKNALKALGYDPEKLEIILYQLVSLSRGGIPVRMSTRKGEFVTLREVMEEVGKEAIRFFFLMRKASSHLNFDLELAKQQSLENPVYYVQYAHARICSIFREAEKKELKIESSELKVADLSLLKEEIEIEIMKKLAFFPDEIAEMVLTREPHGLTVYSQELAALFHKFYTDHRVISEDRNLTLARLILVKAVQVVLANSIQLMGIVPKEKM